MEEDLSLLDYKLKQLKIMLRYEQQQPEEQKYGAHLDHWSGKAKPINLDEKAIKTLIRHYTLRGGRA